MVKDSSGSDQECERSLDAREEKIQIHLMTKVMTRTDPVYRRLVAMTAVDNQCVKEDSKIDEMIPNELEVGQLTDLDAINSSS